MASTINAKNTSSGLVLTPDASGQLELQTADVTRLTIDSSGNVIQASGNYFIGNGSGFGWGDLTTYIGGTSVSDFINFNTNGSERMRIDSSGNVGIGTTVPSSYAPLTVRKYITSGSQQIAASFSDAVNATLSIGFTSGYANFVCDNGQAFYTSNTERMRIDSGGDTYINTTSQATNYGGRMNLWGNYTAQWGLSMNSTSSTGTQFYIAFIRNNSGSAAGTISSTATNSTTYATTSDYRLKENVTPMTGALDKVSLLNPVTYTWKEDGSSGQGFIAHELQAVVPECVVGEKDEVREDGTPVYQGVDTSFLVATLTAAIKELKAELDTVKAELAELKGAA